MRGRPMIGVGDLLRLSAAKHPDRVCMHTHEGDQTFATTNGRVNRLASSLTSLGVGPGDRVAIFAADSFRYVELLLASLKLGTTYVPLNFRLAEPELRTLLAAARPTCLVISERYAPMVAAVRDAVPTLRCVVSFDADELPDGVDHAYEDLVAAGDDREPGRLAHEDDLAGLCYTSGTTGLPKGVMHTQRTTKHFVLQTMIERRLPPTGSHYSPAPIFHVAGMLYPLATIARGGTSLVLESFDPSTVLRWMQSGRLTGCFLVPTMISSLLDHPDVDGGSYDSIDSIAYGGAPMSAPLLRRAMDTFGCEFMNMFGAGTEAGLQTLLSFEDHRRALEGHEHLLGSIGKPAWGIDLRLVDDDMNDVGTGEVGEIVTRAEAVMAGYADQPERTAEVLVDGWFRGGDLAWSDDEGYLYLSGRRNDMIIRGGENVYPIEIEDVLVQLQGVAEAAVVGIPDDHWGEIVCAVIVPEPGATFDPDRAVAHCRAHLAGYKVPAVFDVVDELPRNASGKVLKRELRSHRSAPTLHQR